MWWKRPTISTISAAIVVAAGFWVEPMWPLGDDKWLYTIFCLLFLAALIYLPEAIRWLRSRKIQKTVSHQDLITVDYMQAGMIVDKYIASAMVDANSGVKISVRKQFIDAFSKTTGAMVGPYKYNGVLLRDWLESNAARFLVENVGDMR